MASKMDTNSFIRFLKDEKFIEWKLFPTDELISYWQEYAEQHPEDKDQILLAEKHFNNINISSFEISYNNRVEINRRLEQSLKRHNQKIIFKRLSYVVAACAMVLLASVLYFQYDLSLFGKKPNDSSYIVGKTLESEDILFVTGNKTSSFQNNIDIKIDNNKTAQVVSENKEIVDKKIDIAQNTINKLIVPYGKRSKVSLPDGTQVWLNSGSTLEFPSTFSGKRREVSITGEMYIEVAPNKSIPFYVHTQDYDVRVYGTKFNVSSYSESASSVVLVEGSVGLQLSNKEEVILNPNEQAVFLTQKQNFEKQEVDVNSLISWKEGYLSFNDTPISEALRLIGRYYNLSFNLDDDVTFKGLTCTGKIILSDNLENVMMALSIISDTEYKIQDKQILIFKKQQSIN